MTRSRSAVAGLSALAAVALVVGGSTIAVANGYNPFPQEQRVVEVAYAAPVGDAVSFDRAAAIQTAEDDLAAREKAAADALAAQQAADAAAEAAAAQAAADAQAPADTQADLDAEADTDADTSEGGSQDIGQRDPSITFSPRRCPSGVEAQGVDDASYLVYCAAH